MAVLVCDQKCVWKQFLFSHPNGVGQQRKSNNLAPMRIWADGGTGNGEGGEAGRTYFGNRVGPQITDMIEKLRILKM